MLGTGYGNQSVIGPATLGVGLLLGLLQGIAGGQCAPCPYPKITANDGREWAGFGRAVAASAGRLLVGAPGDDSRGAAYVFSVSDTGWERVATLRGTGDRSELFGERVALAGDTAVVTAPLEDVNCPEDYDCDQGAAYMYRWQSGRWQLTQKILDSTVYHLGMALAFDGRRLVLSGEIQDENVALVFEEVDGRWTKIGSLKASDGEPGQGFAHALALSENRLFVGAPYDGADLAGAFYVFEDRTGSWVEVGKYVGSKAGWHSFFGTSLAMGQGTAFVGAPANNSGGPGRVYAFTIDGVPTELGSFEASDPETGDAFGQAIAATETAVVVGAPDASGSPDMSGAVCVFRRGSDDWVEAARIAAPLSSEGWGFGTAVAADDGLVAIGPGADHEVEDYAGSVFLYAPAADRLAGNVGTGSGLGPVPVLRLDGGRGDDCREIRVTPGKRATLSLDRPPSGGGGNYALWIFDGGPEACGAATPYRDRQGDDLDLGVAARPLPLINLVDGDPAWQARGEGIDGTVLSLVAFADGTGATLYAGGLFESAGDSEAANIARWDGRGWRSVGAGLDHAVRALESFDGALYVGGEFTTAGGTPALRLARWDGSAFSAVGSGASGRVLSLAVHDDGTGPALYVGGDFTSIDGVAANRIARWDGTRFTPLGSGMDGGVLALLSFDDGAGPLLYAGGWFTGAGGAWGGRMARWDGQTWSAVGGGMDEAVRALGVFDEGQGEHLFVGGDFELAGGTPASHVARWSGSAWTSLGTGTDASVTSFASFDDGEGPRLYAGGHFRRAGNQYVNKIARWTVSRWEAAGDGFLERAAVVRALAIADDGIGPALWAGGDFSTAGRTSAADVAVWCRPRCLCPRAFPFGVSSAPLAPATARLLCLGDRRARRAPASFPVRFPAGVFTVCGVIQDRDSIHSPALDLSITNAIVVRTGEE